jgi:hypothetical protein
VPDDTGIPQSRCKKGMQIPLWWHFESKWQGRDCHCLPNPVTGERVSPTGDEHSSPDWNRDKSSRASHAAPA